MPKFFITIIISCLIIQILFSFFYSSQILTQNNQLNQNQTEINQLAIEVENLQKKASDLSSINHLNLSTPSASLVPIIKSLTIGP